MRCYPDHKSMLEAEELDAVCVCTYNSTHAICTIDSLKKGVNVILEKPMCITIEEAAEIIKAEHQSGKLLSIGFQPRMTRSNIFTSGDYKAYNEFMLYEIGEDSATELGRFYTRTGDVDILAGKDGSIYIVGGSSSHGYRYKVLIKELP